jgi:hypothetical protein
LGLLRRYFRRWLRLPLFRPSRLSHLILLRRWCLSARCRPSRRYFRLLLRPSRRLVRYFLWRRSRRLPHPFRLFLPHLLRLSLRCLLVIRW